MIVLGVTQPRLLPASRHWIVKVLHLLVGFVAMALSVRVAKAIRLRLCETPVVDLALPTSGSVIPRSARDAA